jgi:transcriptional regulator with XRE-family HTH domain
MAIFENENTARARTPRERAGGGWGDEFRTRLRALIQSRERTASAFALECGLDPSRVSLWLSGKLLPSAANLKQVTASTNVSLDWLFGLSGRESHEPVYTDRVRTPGELGSEFSSLALQDLPKISRQLVVTLGIIDHKVLVAETSRRLSAEARLWQRWHNGLFRLIRRSARNVYVVLTSLERSEPTLDRRTLALVVEGKIADEVQEVLGYLRGTTRWPLPATKIIQLRRAAFRVPPSIVSRAKRRVVLFPVGTALSKTLAGQLYVTVALTMLDRIEQLGVRRASAADLKRLVLLRTRETVTPAMARGRPTPSQ